MRSDHRGFYAVCIEQGDNDTFMHRIVKRNSGIRRKKKQQQQQKTTRCLLTMSTMPADTIFVWSLSSIDENDISGQYYTRISIAHYFCC